MKLKYCEKSYICGDYKEVYVYPTYQNEYLHQKKRKPKTKTSSEIQRLLNKKARENKLIRLLNANFTADDISFDMTYKKDCRPEDPNEVKKDFQNFIRRVKYLRKKKGLEELKYIAVIEIGERGALHIHVVLSGGLSVTELDELWEKGFTRASALHFNETGLLEKGRYMIKQQSMFFRSFFSSKNLKQPKPTHRYGKVSRSLARDLYCNPGDAERVEKLHKGYRLAEVKGYNSENTDEFYIVLRLYREDATFNGTLKRRKRI